MPPHPADLKPRYILVEGANPRHRIDVAAFEELGVGGQGFNLRGPLLHPAASSSRGLAPGPSRG